MDCYSDVKNVDMNMCMLMGLSIRQFVALIVKNVGLCYGSRRCKKTGVGVWKSGRNPDA